MLGTNKKTYWTICNSLRKELDTIRKELDTIRKIKDHPTINLKDIEENLQEIINDIEDKQKSHPDHNKEIDSILNEIIDIFEWKVWEKPSADEFSKIEKEWVDRYKRKVPPWFEDDKKIENKYWDYFIWKEILELWKKEQKPIIFITGDIKKDWWLNDEWKTIMPLPALRREIFEYCWVDFHMYTPENFLNHVGDININEDINLNIEKTTIDEVKKVGDSWIRNTWLISPEWIINTFISILQDIADRTTFEISSYERESILLIWSDLKNRKLEWIEVYEILDEKINISLFLTNELIDKYEHNKTVREVLSIAILNLKKLLRENSNQKAEYSFRQSQIILEDIEEQLV